MSKPMTAARLAEIRLSILSGLHDDGEACCNGGTQDEPCSCHGAHLESELTVPQCTELADELLDYIDFLGECIAKAPQPNGITVTDIEAFRKWQREALGGGE